MVDKMTIHSPEYGAISIDTSIFDNMGITLETGLFRQLDQFKDGPFRVLITDVVHHEVFRHLVEKVKDARGKLSKALRVAGEHLDISREQLDKAQELIQGSGTDEELVERRLNSFYMRVGGKIIGADGQISVARLTEMYFKPLPPFEPGSDKKHEFPDAIALLILEAYANKEGFKVLAVSSDKGWAKFAEGSAWIDVEEKLADAITKLQPHNTATRLIRELSENLIEKAESEVGSAIKQKIKDSVEEADIAVEACSVYQLEEDDVYADYVSHTFQADAAGKPVIKLIRIEERSIVVQLSAEVECEVHASFGLAVWDSVDKEYIGMGTTHRNIIDYYETEILVTLVGEVSAGLNEVSVEDVEVTETLDRVDFGEVDPDWGDDE
jgi:hypothetical protein